MVSRFCHVFLHFWFIFHRNLKSCTSKETDKPGPEGDFTKIIKEKTGIMNAGEKIWVFIFNLFYACLLSVLWKHCLQFSQKVLEFFLRRVVVPAESDVVPQLRLIVQNFYVFTESCYCLLFFCGTFFLPRHKMNLA